MVAAADESKSLLGTCRARTGPMITATGQQRVLQSAVRVEWFTVVWMTVEAIVSVGAGLLARSLLLTAFGLDSVIELITGSILFWRLRVETRGGSQLGWWQPNGARSR